MDYIEQTAYPVIFANSDYLLSIKYKLQSFMWLDDETLLLMDKNTINLVQYILKQRIYVPTFF